MRIISSAIIKLALVTVLGYYLHKKKHLDDKVLDFLTFYVINFAVPFLIFSHLIDNLRTDFKPSVIIFILISIGLFIFGFFFGYIFSIRKSPELKREFISLITFQNAGYLPMNIAIFLMPPQLSSKFLTYIFLYLLGFNVMMWSIGFGLIFRKEQEPLNLKSFFNPPVLSTLIALLFVYTGARSFIPSLLLSPVRMIGQTGFVVSMLILGAWLAKVKLQGLHKRIAVIAQLSILKLVVLPLLCFLIIIKFEIFSLLGLFIILQASMPSAVSLPIIAHLKGANSGFISQGVFSTHVLSIITIPIWIELFVRFSGLTF